MHETQRDTAFATTKRSDSKIEAGGEGPEGAKIPQKSRVTMGCAFATTSSSPGNTVTRSPILAPKSIWKRLYRWLYSQLESRVHLDTKIDIPSIPDYSPGTEVGAKLDCFRECLFGRTHSRQSIIYEDRFLPSGSLGAPIRVTVEKSKRNISETFIFLSQISNGFNTIGAVMPTSNLAAQAMAAEALRQQTRNSAEVGPGRGLSLPNW